MKEKRNLLIGFVLGVIISSILVFMILPILAKDASYLFGFAIFLILLLIGITFFYVRKKDFFILNWSNDQQLPIGHKNAFRRDVFPWLIISLLFVLFGCLGSIWVVNKNKYFTNNTEQQRRISDQHTELAEALRIGNLVFLMTNVLDEVGEELKTGPKRTLSQGTISKLAALSYSFKPYKWIEADNKSKAQYSPERGLLLLSLLNLNIDSSSFSKIKKNVTFLQAGLGDADLRGADLSGINLEKSFLRNADLRRADLNNARLNNAFLWGANLEGAILNAAEIVNADLRWAELNGAELEKTNLVGSNMTCAKIRQADLQGADLSWTKMNGIHFKSSDLTQAKLIGTDLKRANFSHADLTNASLKFSDLGDAIFTEANFTGTDILRVSVEHVNWFEKLAEWKVIGAGEYHKQFYIHEFNNGQSTYRIDRIGD